MTYLKVGEIIEIKIQDILHEKLQRRIFFEAIFIKFSHDNLKYKNDNNIRR